MLLRQFTFSKRAKLIYIVRFAVSVRIAPCCHVRYSVANLRKQLRKQLRLTENKAAIRRRKEVNTLRKQSILRCIYVKFLRFP